MDEVEESIKEVWLNRDKLLIDLKVVKSWHIRNWKERTDESIAKILMHQFKDLNFVSGDSHVFSQLLVEDLFGDKIKSKEEAKEFNEKTRRGDRKDMGKEAYKIWCRNILKKIVNPNFYINVASNFSEMEISSSTRHNFGQLLDGLFDILKEDNSNVRLGFRIEELAKKFLPELLKVRKSRGKNGKPKVIQRDGASLFKDVINLTFDEALASLGKFSAIRWETLAFCKSGAAMGVNYGSLSKQCYKQYEESINIMTDVIGDDPSVLEPGFYSKMLRK